MIWFLWISSSCIMFILCWSSCCLFLICSVLWFFIICSCFWRSSITGSGCMSIKENISINSKTYWLGSRGLRKCYHGRHVCHTLYSRVRSYYRKIISWKFKLLGIKRPQYNSIKWLKYHILAKNGRIFQLTHILCMDHGIHQLYWWQLEAWLRSRNLHFMSLRYLRELPFNCFLFILY